MGGSWGLRCAQRSLERQSQTVFHMNPVFSASAQDLGFLPSGLHVTSQSVVPT